MECLSYIFSAMNFIRNTHSFVQSNSYVELDKVISSNSTGENQLFLYVCLANHIGWLFSAFSWPGGIIVSPSICKHVCSVLMKMTSQHLFKIGTIIVDEWRNAMDIDLMLTETITCWSFYLEWICTVDASTLYLLYFCFVLFLYICKLMANSPLNQLLELYRSQ